MTPAFFCPETGVTDMTNRELEIGITNTLTAGELLNRLPEIDHIEDDDIRVETKNAFLDLCPDYFWNVAAASGTYHLPENRGKHGLWSHTKMAFTVAERLLPSYTERGLLNEQDADCVRSAILLHDIFKRGFGATEGPLDSSSKYHDRLAATVLAYNTDLPDVVIHAVDAHNGPWYEGDEPSPVLAGRPEFDTVFLIANLVHTCDMVASTPNVRPGLYEPNAALQAEIDDYIDADFQ